MAARQWRSRPNCPGLGSAHLRTQGGVLTRLPAPASSLRLQAERAWKADIALTVENRTRPHFWV